MHICIFPEPGCSALSLASLSFVSILKKRLRIFTASDHHVFVSCSLFKNWHMLPFWSYKGYICENALVSSPRINFHNLFQLTTHFLSQLSSSSLLVTSSFLLSFCLNSWILFFHVFSLSGPFYLNNMLTSFWFQGCCVTIGFFFSFYVIFHFIWSLKFHVN